MKIWGICIICKWNVFISGSSGKCRWRRYYIKCNVQVCYLLDVTSRLYYVPRLSFLCSRTFFDRAGILIMFFEIWTGFDVWAKISVLPFQQVNTTKSDHKMFKHRAIWNANVHIVRIWYDGIKSIESPLYRREIHENSSALNYPCPMYAITQIFISHIYNSEVYPMPCNLHFKNL